MFEGTELDRIVSVGRQHRDRLDFIQAEASFRAAIILDSNDPLPIYELGKTLFLEEELEMALVEFQRSNELRVGFYLVQPYIYLCQRCISGAIDFHNSKILAVGLESPDFRDQQDRRVESESRKIVEEIPECALAHFLLANSIMKRDMWKAEDAFSKCLSLRPDDTTAIYALFHLGRLMKIQGRYAEGMNLWRKIQIEFPNNCHSQKFKKYVPYSEKSTRGKEGYDIMFFEYWREHCVPAMTLIDKLPQGDLYYYEASSTTVWVFVGNDSLIVSYSCGRDLDDSRQLIDTWCAALRTGNYVERGSPCYGAILPPEATDLQVVWFHPGDWCGVPKNFPLPKKWDLLPRNWSPILVEHIRQIAANRKAYTDDVPRPNER